jgi:hypothetical protein
MVPHQYLDPSIIITEIYTKNSPLVILIFGIDSSNMPFDIMIIVLYSVFLPTNVYNMAVSSIMEIIQKILMQKCREINKVS